PLTQAAKEQGKWKRHEFKTTPPLPTYLVAMAVGPMDIAHNPEFDLKRADGSSLRIRILTPKGKASLATLALRETAPILKLEEAYFGSPYPFAKLDLVAVPDFAAGAMENPGLITYRDRLLLMDEKTVTQRELQSFADTHAHELAHIWFGDLVTMKWWDDLWLNEAFATWFAAKIVHQYRPDWQVPIGKLGGKTWVMDVDSTSAARRIREPIISRGDILNAFDGITYTKGAAILQMFEGLIGETAFRDGVRAYLKEKAWGSATFADLAKALATSSGRPELPAAIAGFLDQAGVPLIGLRRDQANSLSLSQSRWSPLGKAKLEGGPWALPFCWRSLAQSKSTCRLLGAEQTVPGPAGALLPNPNMLSYAVWKLPSNELEELLGSFQTLSEMEQVAVLQNLRKLYRSGDLSPSTLQRITPNLLLSEHERVVSTALSLHGELGRLVNDEQIDAWKKLRNALIGGLLKRYGWGEASDKDSARWRLRNQVLSIAGHAGHRPKVIAEAKVISDAFLKGQSVSRETLSTALSISAEHGDEALFDEMLSQLLSSNDVRRRNSLRGALGRFRFDRVVERLFALVDHKELRANERSGMLWPVAGDHRTRVEAWQRLKPLLPKLNALLPRRGMRYLPYFPGSACRESLDSELVEAFKPWIQKVDGIERHLKSARENLQQCLALRRAYGDELIEILAP
ncbi:MAG: M1 family aminopeptidase, partial [Myxococcota bacterium]|nr:M1 family aminopeptidase [Myxococcota bacterium]